MVFSAFSIKFIFCANIFSLITMINIFFWLYFNHGARINRCKKVSVKENKVDIA